MKSDNDLKRKFGQQNPFAVPDGYFDEFADRIKGYTGCAEPIPADGNATESGKISLFVRVKPYLYLAATFAGLFFGIQVFEHFKASLPEAAPSAETAMQAQPEGIDDEYIDDVCRYAGIDKSRIYSYATGQDTY